MFMFLGSMFVNICIFVSASVHVCVCPYERKRINTERLPVRYTGMPYIRPSPPFTFNIIIYIYSVYVCGGGVSYIL